MYPWQDYSGRLSPLKLAVFVALFLPALWTAFAFGMGWLQPRPFTEAIHQVGLWMLRFLFIALAILAGVFALLVGFRLLVQLGGVRGKLPAGWVGALGLAASVLTALGEAVYFWLALGVDPVRVLSANWSLVVGWRPAAIVLGLGLAVTAIGAGRALVPVIGKRLPRVA